MRGIVLRPDAPHGVRDAVFPGVAAHQVRAVLELLAGVPHGDAAARPADHLQIVAAVAEGDALPGVQPQEMGQLFQTGHFVDVGAEDIAFGHIVKQFYTKLVPSGRTESPLPPRSPGW